MFLCPLPTMSFYRTNIPLLLLIFNSPSTPPFFWVLFLLASLPGSYNGGDSTISLNGKFAIQIYREDATQPSETAALAGTVNPGEFFIVCNDAEVFNTVYNGECSEEVSTILSDGDDVVSLVQLVVENGALNLVPSDVYGTIGESGESKHLILYLYSGARTRMYLPCT